jgi:signal transduction histidine kinase
MYQTSSTYLGLVQETATIIADELAAANARTLNYVKSLWEIAGRPNAESPLRSAFGRAEAVVNLTAHELETSLRSNLEVTEKLLAQGKKLQQQGYESAKEMADKALTNAKQVVEAASERIESLTEKVDDLEVPAKKKRVTASAE